MTGQELIKLAHEGPCPYCDEAVRITRPPPERDDMDAVCDSCGQYFGPVAPEPFRTGFEVVNKKERGASQSANFAAEYGKQPATFDERRKAIFGDKVFPAGTSQALIDEDRGP